MMNAMVEEVYAKDEPNAAEERACMLWRTLDDMWYKLKDYAEDANLDEILVGLIKKVGSFNTAEEMLNWAIDVEASIKKKKVDALNTEEREEEEEGMSFISVVIGGNGGEMPQGGMEDSGD